MKGKTRQLATFVKAWKLRSKFKRPDDLVFPNGKGDHVGHDNVVKRRFIPVFERLESACREAPMSALKPPRRFNWHGLRHFAISTWIEAGLAPKTAQTFAGHASLQITMDR
jgi:integrase